jgi:hypothetical protein
MQDILYEIRDPTQGFGRMLRDWMRAETNFPDVLWKIQVDHKLGVDAADSAYGHDLLFERRREMMGRYDDYCSKPVPEPKAGKVFKLTDKRRTA